MVPILDQDSDKSDNEHEENRKCCFLWKNQTTNVLLKPLVLQKQHINYFGLILLATA